MSVFSNELASLCERCGIAITDEQLAKMDICYTVLLRENQKTNLTRILDPDEAALKHFVDSILPCPLFKEGAEVLDVGSGGGFPAIPLAIMRPDLHVTALEASEKKCAYMRLATSECGVDMRIACGRAEELSHGPMREAFDACTARAVASLPILAELTVPFVRVGGLVMLYKADYEEELQSASGAMGQLGIHLQRVMSMPAELLDHHILVFEKGKATPARFPRRYAKIKSAPL